MQPRAARLVLALAAAVSITLVGTSLDAWIGHGDDGHARQLAELQPAPTLPLSSLSAPARDVDLASLAPLPPPPGPRERPPSSALQH
jgi:hypothetical protein